jgi:hypothetical protein
MTDPTIAAWSRESDLLFQLRQLREENERLRTALRTTLKQPRQEPKPVACRFCYSQKGCWTWQCYKCGEIDDVQKPAPLPVQEPVAWAVQACSKMWRGEFAEIDAKAEAKRIGGTCVAFALYTEPPQRPWVGLTDEDKQTAVWTNGTFGGGALWAQQLLKERNE